MNDASIYPSGSYSSRVSFLNPAPTSSTPLPLSLSTLQQTGSIDTSSLLLEAGRQSFLYFHLPGTSTIQSKTLDSLSAAQDQSRANPTNADINVIMGIAVSFGPTNGDDSIIIIPITYDINSPSQTPGVAIVWVFNDTSTVVRITVSPPSSMCSTNSTSAIDGCIPINYNVHTIINNNKISSPLLVQTNAACGDVCLSASSSCSVSCTTCDGQQVAGADTPVSRRYNMGASSAVFRFDYDTFTVKDRIKIWNGPTLLFDTGCVGASGIVNVSYSSTSPIIRVDVEPDCACTNVHGCTGTAWWFQVYCLSNTTGRGDYLHSEHFQMLTQ